MTGDFKERPIIFSTENVKAILDGRKTQTRRVIKPQPDKAFDKYGIIGFSESGGDYYPLIMHLNIETGKDEEYVVGDERQVIKCPYGQVCDSLWVREIYFMGSMTPTLQAYIEFADFTKHEPFVPADAHIQQRGWHPSIHLPRWASRIDLEITEIRVERLQEINSKRHDEVLQEGYPFGYDIENLQEHPVNTFARYWDSLNAKYPWESNPWVWVISFKRLNPLDTEFSKGLYLEDSLSGGKHNVNTSSSELYLLNKGGGHYDYAGGCR